MPSDSPTPRSEPAPAASPIARRSLGEPLAAWALDYHLPEELLASQGRGTLMADLLRVLRIAPDFTDAAGVHLIETSPRLRAIQETTLAEAGTAIQWHARIEDLPPGPMIVIANEFFDALPIRQFRWSGEAWAERMIGIDSEGNLAFALRPVDQRALAIPLPEGAIIETSPIATTIITTISTRIAGTGGALLVIDYGAKHPGHGDTLQAVRQHQYTDPLTAPGEADLTAHVDFATLTKAASTAGARPRTVLTQGEFLNRLGQIGQTGLRGVSKAGEISDWQTTLLHRQRHSDIGRLRQDRHATRHRIV